MCNYCKRGTIAISLMLSIVVQNEFIFKISGWGLLVVCLHCETNYVFVGQNPSPQCQQLSLLLIYVENSRGLWGACAMKITLSYSHYKCKFIRSLKANRNSSIPDVIGHVNWESGTMWAERYDNEDEGLVIESEGNEI